jgi:hypothetical protein
MYGGFFEAFLRDNTTGANNISTAYGGYFRIQNVSTHGGTIANAYSIRVNTPGGTGNITNLYGVRVENMGRAGVTNGYGVYIVAQSGATTLTYALYAAGGQSYHAGNFGIGSAAVAQTPAAPLHVVPSDAVTNTSSIVAIFGHDSTATTLTDFGGQNIYRARAQTTNGQTVADTVWGWTVATNATRRGYFSLAAYDFNAIRREGVRIGTDGTNVQLGLWGSPQVGKGSTGQVLQVDGSGNVVWGAPPAITGGGLANPMTTLGDIIVGGASGASARLGVGSAGQVLTVVSGQPAWAAASGGSGSGSGVSIASITKYGRR